MRSSCSFLHNAPLRQGADAHGSYGKLHVEPMNLGVQSHENELTPSTHVAPFRHGLGAHSSMSTSQRSPVNPGWQSQVKVLMPSMQVPLFLQV